MSEYPVSADDLIRALRWLIDTEPYQPPEITTPARIVIANMLKRWDEQDA